MKKLKSIPGQLLLFDIGRYQIVRSYSNYVIEDGYDASDNSITQPETLTEPVIELSAPVGEPASINSITEPQTLTKSVIELSAPASGLTIDAVNLYQPGGTAKGRHQYFRFSWRSSSGVNHRHIPGGNSTSAIATSRAAQVREALATGSSIAEVLELIRSW